MQEKIMSGEEHQSMKNSNASHHKRVTFQVSNIALVFIVVVLCGLSFFGGVSYQKHHSPSKVMRFGASSSGSNGSGFGSGGFGGHRSGGFGQVSSVSSSSITVADQRTGKSSTYAINSSTTITDNGQSVGVSDIQTGDTVIIMTSGGSSTTATRILVNPSFGGGSPAGSSSVGGSQTTN